MRNDRIGEFRPYSIVVSASSEDQSVLKFVRDSGFVLRKFDFRIQNIYRKLMNVFMKFKWISKLVESLLIF